MTWTADYTRRIDEELIGIDPEIREAVTDLVKLWTETGPSRTNRHDVAEMELFETPVGARHLMGYIIDDERQRFALLWLREKPLRR